MVTVAAASGAAAMEGGKAEAATVVVALAAMQVGAETMVAALAAH